MRVAHSLRKPEMLHRMLLTSATPQHAHTSVSLLHLLLLSLPGCQDDVDMPPSFSFSWKEVPVEEKIYIVLLCMWQDGMWEVFCKDFQTSWNARFQFLGLWGFCFQQSSLLTVFTTLRLFSPSASVIKVLNMEMSQMWTRRWDLLLAIQESSLVPLPAFTESYQRSKLHSKGLSQ